ncbi:MAG: indole-3-glycerol phosphate synthase TrpC [Desulfuromonas sp.]|jgi:indole-3-glycerol phosphate synthase|nr:MAG: indole-3-glycerol phosphate synthase TrpC [Desulfuromonas sp.]
MILDKILAHKQIEVAAAKGRYTIAELEEMIAQAPVTRGFEQRLRDQSEHGVAIIAEVKKGSPSKGIIRADFDPVAIARGYEAAGASCLSVLTDECFFYGHLDFLRQIAAEVRLPLLRKDFVIDAHQIYEARAFGADAILLIAAALTLEQLREFHALARRLQLDVLLEVHNEEELELALQTDCTLLGINNRCLKTFVTDLAVSERLIPRIPASRLIVSESGIQDYASIQRLRQAGAGAFLIGESLMREGDFATKLSQLLGHGGE